jgi:hypothetical protein
LGGLPDLAARDPEVAKVTFCGYPNCAAVKSPCRVFHLFHPDVETIFHFFHFFRARGVAPAVVGRRRMV